jgi:sulfur relay (sulfurtransferase) complex TusBCD TusD component (DsrE family)
METPITVPQDINPMSDEQYQLINEILQSCKNTEVLAQGCQQCGLDIGTAAETNAGQMAICQKLKSTFFPNRP